jgi:hypothetical protein
MIGIGECGATYKLGHEAKGVVDLLVGLVIVWFMGLIVRDHLRSFLDSLGACPCFLLLLQLGYKFWIPQLCS